jgi:hypothetical protein
MAFVHILDEGFFYISSPIIHIIMRDAEPVEFISAISDRQVNIHKQAYEGDVWGISMNRKAEINRQGTNSLPESTCWRAT